jgi:hypothetical protein
VSGCGRLEPRRARWRASLLAASVSIVAATALAAGELKDAVLVLEMAPGSPGSEASGAPPRFALLRDGQVFVGGTAHVEAGRLERREAQALLKRADGLRRAAASGPIAFGAGERSLRLRLLEDDPVEIVATGDPTGAGAAHAALSTFVQELASFHHPTLRPYAPSSYAVSAREARLAGGCRAWSFPFPVAQALSAPQSVSAADADGWPKGALPASVCVDDKRYAVTLRPLLPGESP